MTWQELKSSYKVSSLLTHVVRLVQLGTFGYYLLLNFHYLTAFIFHLGVRFIVQPLLVEAGLFKKRIVGKLQNGK